MKTIALIFILFINYSLAVAQTTIPLYKDSIPNSKPTIDREESVTTDGILRISKISRPALTIYEPDKKIKNGTAIIICPGGGYSIEAAGHEGSDVAMKFTEAGITAFVLKYRIPDDSTMISKEIGPLQDAQRAIQLVRENAKAYGIKKNKIGLMGFSAGGHLASTAGTHFKHAYIDNPKNTSLRPDFLILIYPVISFNDSIGHIGSRNQLLGKNPSEEKIKEYSNELQVTQDTPPAFLVQAKDDPVKYQNSTVFAQALHDHGVVADVYLYEKGGHGYGMNNKSSIVKWMDLVEEWLKKMKFD
ncbi:MAG TPA: alpha/beta hydrolase [Mucilaginibacter sp.]|jgi:acetyl esterase/lipase